MLYAVAVGQIISFFHLLPWMSSVYCWCGQ